jgi:hypothetical protein
MHLKREQMSLLANLRNSPFVAAGGWIRRQIHLKKAFKNRRQGACDKASPVAAVMLHLRSRYVSKAAILTLPIQLVPVENRSPA